MELLVNNTEQVQPDDYDGTIIRLHGRSPEHPEEVTTVDVHEFQPYFYAPLDEVEGRENELINQECIQGIDPDGDYESLRGVSLAKIWTPYPQDVREAREFFEDHYAADVAFTNRFRIDTGLRDWVEVPDEFCHYREIEPVEGHTGDETPTPEGGESGPQDIVPRVCTLDIEVDDRADGFPEPGEERILSIVAHDSYTDETVGWMDLDGRSLEATFPTDLLEDDEPPGDLDELHCRPDERQMLIDFACWIDSTDPDIVTAWNTDFDIPFLIRRMENVGAAPSRLARDGWAGLTNRDEPRLKGRTVYDLLEVYKKNSWTELRSYSLDSVAEKELDESKLEFSGSVYNLWENDPVRLLEYNSRDVDLAVRIDQEAGVIEFRDTLRREVGVDFEDSYDNKDFVDMMCRRKLFEWGKVGPTRPAYGDEPDNDFEGAFVFEPYQGIAENVVGMDLASLYPYTMKMLNASPETKSPDGNIEAANGTHFHSDEVGLFPSLVEDAIGLKSEYKERREGAETEEERKKWAVKYHSAKTITNSVYGVCGWSRFFLYDKDVAEAVTLTGQSVIKATAEFIGDHGDDVIYGDTDSCYVRLPHSWSREQCLDKAQEYAARLNREVYPNLVDDFGIPGECLWDIEVEAFMERYFQAGRKKRYAYIATWKEGNEIEDPEPTIVGFASRRSDTAQLTVDTEQRLLDAILSGEPEKISDIIFEASKQIRPVAPDWELIGIPGGFGQHLPPAPPGADPENYYSANEDGSPNDAHPRGAWNANHILDKNYGKGDKPMRVYLDPHHFEEVEKQIDVICYEEAADMEPIEDTVRVDTPKMIDTIIKSPLRLITRAASCDIDAATQGQSQTGLGAFG